jgi:hypothetical protein
MKKQIVAILVLASTLSYSAELRVGKGTFNWNMGVANFMDASFGLDVTVLSLANPHDNFSDSNYYYFYDADLYISSFVNKMTTMATYPITYDFGNFGSVNDAVADNTDIPVPSDYKVAGFDMNFGVGYDLYHENKNYFGLSVTTGFSMPVMKMENLVKTAAITYEILDKTDTTNLTYKLGLGMQAGAELMPGLMLNGSASFGLQTGYMENDWFGSSFDVDGNFNTFNIALKYIPFETHTELGGINFDPQLYFILGFTHKSWDVDKATVDMAHIFSVESFGVCDLEFSSNAAYIGVGYNF